MALPEDRVAPPAIDQLIRDLECWRAKGVTQLRNLDLPALRQAALASGLADTSSQAGQPAVIKDVVRRALATIAGSVSSRCGLVLLGLDPDTFDLAPNLLREDAADIFGVSTERFRRQPQRAVLTTVAEGIFDLCQAHRSRLERLALERRHPADTRLAVLWLERFESYFQIWTPMFGLGADLTAYRETLIDPDAPPKEFDSEPEAARESQEGGYGAFALYHYACVLAAEQKFMARYGGLWLLSSAQAEVQIRDDLHAVTLATSMNERDRSWLRTIHERADGELHPFLQLTSEDTIGAATLCEWDSWLQTCQCQWLDTQRDSALEYFPTARYHDGISDTCSLHGLVEAANRFCAGIEQEWLRVADWYVTTSIA